DPVVGGSRLQVGDEIFVTTKNGKVAYSVISSRTYDRDDLRSVPELWSARPGQLVLVTCLFDTEQRSIAKNVVIYARLLPPESS
ncbi:MAG: class F sortase, partial [Bowdeniella nasicola]|nr:class F sortase [Bowdeniella nasicola]